jgi:hypothetical protein
LTTATSTGWFLVRCVAVAFAIESLMIAWLPVVQSEHGSVQVLAR